MDKIAVTEAAILELLAKRWSPRAFDARPVDPEKLKTCFEAARWSPSSSNEQPWSFIHAEREGNPSAFSRLAECLVPANREWAPLAPVLLLTIARREFAGSGKPNRHALHDTGQALAYFTVQATALGLFVHPMAGFDIDKARETLGVPDTHDPVAMAAVGYLGDPSSLADTLRERELQPRARKLVTEFVYEGRWGNQGR